MNAGVKPLSSTSLGSQPCPDRNLCPFPSDFNLSFQSNTIFSPYFPHSQQSPLVLRGKVTLKVKACVALFSHEFTPSTHLHTQLRRKFSSNSTSIFPPLFQTLSAPSLSTYPVQHWLFPPNGSCAAGPGCWWLILGFWFSTIHWAHTDSPIPGITWVFTPSLSANTINQGFYLPPLSEAWFIRMAPLVSILDTNRIKTAVNTFCPALFTL